jgi:hypothetical protein
MSELHPHHPGRHSRQEPLRNSRSVRFRLALTASRAGKPSSSRNDRRHAGSASADRFHNSPRRGSTARAALTGDTGAYERVPGRSLAIVGVIMLVAAGAVGTFLALVSVVVPQPRAAAQESPVGAPASMLSTETEPEAGDAHRGPGRIVTPAPATAVPTAQAIGAAGTHRTPLTRPAAVPSATAAASPAAMEGTEHCRWCDDEDDNAPTTAPPTSTVASSTPPRSTPESME